MNFSAEGEWYPDYCWRCEIFSRIRWLWFCACATCSRICERGGKYSKPHRVL